MVGIHENISGTQYATIFNTNIDVTLTNEFSPYLYPNQYVNFNKDSKVVALASELAYPANDDITVVTNIYNYMISNISYDYDKATTVEKGYLPVVDEILDTKKGICFDYSALMTSMLRTQNIPTKLVIGYAGSTYHAWISVYTEEQGWVDNAIHFDGTSWKFMDPTFASNGKGDPKITEYTTIWMDSLRNGESALSNTNKLVRNYSGCTGLKTGSTSLALFNLSASATRDGLSLIAVVMKSPTSACLACTLVITPAIGPGRNTWDADPLPIPSMAPPANGMFLP